MADSGQVSPLPHNFEVEQALLGALLFDSALSERVRYDLAPEHFHDPLHADIYAAILSLVDQRRSVTPLTLAPLFSSAPPLSSTMSVPQYLGVLLASTIGTAQVKDYAALIVDLALRRDLYRLGEDVIARTLTQDGPEATARGIIADAEAALFALAEQGKDAPREASLGDASARAMATIEQAYKAGGGLSGLSTGFRSLDSMLGGLRASDLIILAGRPSMGKTALALNISDRIASRQNVPVGFFSLEMSDTQLANRILADRSGISADLLTRGQIRDNQFRVVMEAQAALAKVPLHIDQTGGISIGTLAARARRMKRRYGIKLLVVDYLQLMQASAATSRANRVQEITEITMGLKAIAKELDIPVLALSQLSRAVEQREDKRPQLSDLRESGSIEQDADVVIFAFREEYYVERTRPNESDEAKYREWQTKMTAVAGRAEAIIGKNRHGRVGIVPLAFQGDLTRFDDLAHENEGMGR